ncbi:MULTISPECIES: flavin reductase family protein [Actinomadura]|uniref:Flavin reductase family protein n=1 Tax=Actinomadura yumaensis TaxID=111807 RepID=A0ABW2D1E2_9ACTN|nr:flavin reductase family protein [Actinomadura sp. J1-007]MWK37990.1 flavin reductase [Actinomadura sp. J1-007]
MVIEACAVTGAQRFRDVMRHFPTGVTVLTTTGPAGPHGMTANAVMSLSLSPPSVLAAVHHGTNTHAILRTAATFTVNILAADQRDCAELFARSDPAEDPFRTVHWEPSAVTGDPVLTESLATFDCHVERRIAVADHSLIVGTVADAAIHRPDAAPMVFARSRFQTTTPP